MQRVLVAQCLMLGLIAGAACAALLPGPTDNGTYWHNWSDEDGVTHLAECHFANWTYVAYLPPSDPLFLNVFGTAHNVQLANQPAGWQGPWHKDPVPQLVIFLAGQGLWKFMDGTSHTFSQGDIYFGNDQNSTKGHESFAYGNGSLILAMIQFPNLSTTMHRPCWLV